MAAKKFDLRQYPHLLADAHPALIEDDEENQRVLALAEALPSPLQARSCLAPVAYSCPVRLFRSKNRRRRFSATDARAWCNLPSPRTVKKRRD
jgi:hypothetical protein